MPTRDACRPSPAPRIFRGRPAGAACPTRNRGSGEAQAHLRRTSTSLAPGELLLVGRRREEIVAAARLRFDETPTLLATFIAALAVSRTVRGLGGAVASEALETVKQEAMARTRASGATHALLTGNIHHANAPSRRLVERAGFEPASVPTGEYQEWSLLLPLGG